MPEVADDPTAATLMAWLVDEAADFGGAQSIATVETASSLLSIEVSEPGVLIKSLVEPGEEVHPGSPLAVLGAPGEVVEDVEQLMVQLGLAVAPGADDPDVHLRAVPHEVLRRTAWLPHEPVPDDEPEATGSPSGQASADEDSNVVPLSRSEEPATTVTRQVRLREQVRADALVAVVSTVEAVSLTALVVKAVAVTTRRIPLLSGTSSVTDVAVQRWTEAGAVAPVVHVAGLMTATSVTSTLRGLDARVRDGRVATGEIRAATVTVVDLGMFRAGEASLDATADHPAVLTLGGVREQPVIEDGAVVPGQTMTVTLSCDADRIEASTAALWLTHLAKALEQPLHFLT